MDKIKKRQRLRYFSMLLVFLLFPITINYFSPYVSIMGSSEGIINGSLFVFAGFFVLSLFLGRFWCAFFCPAAGIQEACSLIQPKRFKNGWSNIIKYFVWLVWLALVIMMFIMAGGIAKADFLYMTDNGISINAAPQFIIYYVVVLIMGVVLPLMFGKRASCHVFCWMAPFMVIGTWVSRKLRLPRLRMKADSSSCIKCGACARGCPQSIEVMKEVQKGEILHTECITCMNCADVCPKGVLKPIFMAGK